MTLTSIGDLSHGFLIRQRNVTLKTQMARLTQELSSGRSADVTRHLNGSFGRLADIEHRHAAAEALRTGATEAALFTSAMQGALDQVKAQLSEVGGAAALAGTSPSAGLRAAAATAAVGALDAALSALNTSVAGRTLFAGTDVIGPALETRTALVDAARIAVGGATDTNSFTAALDAFFDPGGGFETAIYLGGTDDLAPFQLGDGQSVDLRIRADDETFREGLKNLLTVHLAEDNGVALSQASRSALMASAGDALLTGVADVVRIQADLGYAESRIDQARARIAAEITSLDFARNELLAVDPFDAAAELENVQFQLETLYTVTARTARLNLMSFL